MKNDLYHNNLKAFKERYPEYVDMVEQAPKNKDLALRKTKSFPTLFNKKTNTYFYDKANPVQAAGTNIAMQEIYHSRLTIVLGFCIGYETIYYTEQCSKKFQTEKIIIVEHDPYMIRLAMQCVDLRPFFGLDGVKLLLGFNDYLLFKRLLDEFYIGQHYYLLRAMRMIYNDRYFSLYRDYYVKAAGIVRNAASHALMYFGNDCKDSLIGIQNMFSNLKEIIENPGINLLKDKFKGVPAVCVASGPSLNGNIDQLKGIEDKCVLLACDASLKPLLEKGIKPHLVTSLEREIEVVELFENIEEEYDDVYFSGCPVVYNEVYQAYKGPKVIVYRQFDHFKWLQIERGMLEIKVSPGNMNFKIAEYLGCDPIILVGQDLAIDGDRTNVSNTPLGESQDSYLKEPKFEVKGNYKDTVTTTRSLNLMLESFIIDVDEYKGECINATEGGAFINGTKIMDLKWAMMSKLVCRRDIRSEIKTWLESFEPDLFDYEKIYNNAGRSIKTFEENIIKCDKIIDYINKTELKTDKKVEEAFKEIIDTKNSFAEDEFTWQLYFAHLSQSIFISHEIDLNNLLLVNRNKTEAKKELIERSKEYFEMIKGLTKICIKDLNIIKSKIKKEG